MSDQDNDLLQRADQHLNWADDYFDAGEFQRALDEVDIGLDLAEQAVETTQGAREAMDTLADAYNLRGAILEELGRLPEAADMYREALNVDPNRHEAHDNLRDLLKRLDQSEERLVTVATFNAPLEAHIARGLLETEGLFAFVRDENTIGANWLYANAIGWVQLQVPADQAEAARDILGSQPADLPAEAYEDAEEVDPVCPKCGATGQRLEYANRRLAFLAWFLINIPIPRLRLRYACPACGHVWFPDDEN